MIMDSTFEVTPTPGHVVLLHVSSDRILPSAAAPTFNGCSQVDTTSFRQKFQTRTPFCMSRGWSTLWVLLRVRTLQGSDALCAFLLPQEVPTALAMVKS